MAKIAIYHDEAKRLYVQEGLSLDTIADILNHKVSRRTLYNWKVAGDWDTKRKNYLKDTEDIQSQLMQLFRTMLKEALTNPSAQNVNAVLRTAGAIKLWQGVKVIEEESANTSNPTESLRELIKAIAAEEIK